VKRTKIAPVLQDFIRHYGYDDHPMRKEVAALLAIARAADDDELWQMGRDERDDPGLYPAWKRLHRALARLERPSGSSRGSGRGTP